MRPIAEQPAYTAVKISWDQYLILDAADAAALQDIILRNPIYEEESRRFKPADKRMAFEIVPAAQIDFPTPPLSDAVAMALRK